MDIDMRVWDEETGLPIGETEEERAAREERELAIIVKGEADIDAGLGLEWEDVAAYFAALDRGETAAFPQPRGR